MKNEERFIRYIKIAIKKFSLNLDGLTILTEAATGNYVVTPVIAALAGAKVFAVTKDSKYGTIKKVISDTKKLARSMGVENRIVIIDSISEVDFNNIDILTNSGFLRPINEKIINQLKKTCVIPLMWEPWEYREADLDLNACHKRGIKVYGTNEDDYRLKTKEYIGKIILYFLLRNKQTSSSSKILILGCDEFRKGIESILTKNDYTFDYISDYNKIKDVSKYTFIGLCELNVETELIGSEISIIYNKNIDPACFVLHIAGKVDFNDVDFIYEPKKIAQPGHMSLTTDFIDPMAVIDLHTAGFKVAEGLITANRMKLKGIEYKDYVINNYPALSFEDPKFW